MYKEVDAIATTRFLGAEQDVHVWSTALTNLEHVDTLLRFRDSFPRLQVRERTMGEMNRGGGGGVMCDGIIILILMITEVI